VRNVVFRLLLQSSDLRIGENDALFGHLLFQSRQTALE